MKFKRFFATLPLVVLANAVIADDNFVVRMDTSLGQIRVQLDPLRAPLTVKNFLAYVEDDSYAGTVFHRVIPGFMIQGGGHLPDMTEVPESAPLHNEADNGLSNLIGTIAMARTNAIDSAGRQFFINVEDNDHLDHSSESCTREEMEEWQAAVDKGLMKPLQCRSFGYAVFGHVIEGMDILHQMELVETGENQGHEDVPLEPILIRSVKLEQ